MMSESNKPLQLEWKPRANLDRKSIAIYLGIERGNPKADLKAIESIDNVIEQVRQFPQIGKRFKHERLANEYRMAQASPYLIFYRVDNGAVVVYRVLHQRQNIDEYELIDRSAWQ